MAGWKTNRPPIYFINLARRTDRRAWMEEQLSKLGLAAQRIEAVTPDDIDVETLDRHTSRRNLFHIRATELSCTLSHHVALRQFLASDEQHCLILEDDAVLSPAVLELLELPLSGFNILRLETCFLPQHHFTRGEHTLGRFKMSQIASRCAGSAAYVVDRTAAQSILDTQSARSIPYDYALFHVFRSKGRRLRAMQLVPALAVQEDRIVPGEYQGDVQVRDGQRAPKPRHLVLVHAMAFFWQTDVKVNAIKTLNRLLGRTHRVIVPAALE